MAFAGVAADARRALDGGGGAEASVVVGARSALVLALRAISGLIVVDEEHDPSYKQEDGVHYHARDMAVLRALAAQDPRRARLGDPVARIGRQHRGAAATSAFIWRPSRRRGLRTIAPIDMRRERPRARTISSRRGCGRWGKTALERGEQSLLFLNRRGYAPLTLCRTCGIRLQCPSCDAWLVDHRFTRPARVPSLRVFHAAAGGVRDLPRRR